jgi:hypothetical protein
MLRPALLAAIGLTLAAAPAAAQSWDGTYGGGYRADARSYPNGYDARYDGDRYGYRSSNAAPSNFDWRSQLDRPGDYRCDAFWDASRDDCGARWRDQRRRVSPEARRDYRALAGYSRDGYGDSYGQGYRYGYGHAGYGSRRGYGSAYDYGHAQGSTTYHGAYGRPDHVYPGGGSSYGGYTGGYGGGYGSGYSGGSRADWCRATYRSYNPSTGYYRAYSGRLVYCG